MWRTYFPICAANANFTCNSSRVVYLLTCKKCSLQYAGQTKCKLNERIWEHRLSIIHNNSCRYLISHFNSNDHSVNDLCVQIIESLDISQNLVERENFWIRFLNTAFPFGLNDNITGYGNISDGLDPLQKATHPYFAIPVVSAKKRPSGTRKKRKSKQINVKVIEELERIFTISGAGMYNAVQFLRKQSQQTLQFCYKKVVFSTFTCDNQLKLLLMAYLAGFYHRPKNVKRLLQIESCFLISIILLRSLIWTACLIVPSLEEPIRFP